MGEPRKIIRDYRFEPDKALAHRKAVIERERARLKDDSRLVIDGGRRVIPPYYPREPINAGDEMSPSGTKVELSELADDVTAAIVDSGAAAALREVTLTFPDTVPAGTAINVQTGTYFGGGPATVFGDADVTFPATGAAFADEGRIEVLLNGQDLVKGSGIGIAEAQWVSQTQVAFDRVVYTGNQVIVRAPVP